MPTHLHVREDLDLIGQAAEGLAPDAGTDVLVETISAWRARSSGFAPRSSRSTMTSS